MNTRDEIMNFGPSIKEMEEKIDKILYVNDRMTNSNWDKANEKIQKMKEQFSKENNISIERVNDLVSARDRYLSSKKVKENVDKKKWTDSVGLDWTNDIEKAENNYSRYKTIYQRSMYNAKQEGYIKSVEPDKISPDFLYYLKNTKCNENIYNIALDKFASSIKPEQINEDVLKFLYENKYIPKQQDSVLSFSYKMYCDGKEKDAQIKDLKKKNKDKDEVIEEKNDLINELDARANSLESALDRLKNKARGFANIISQNISRIGELQKAVEYKEQRGFFAVLGEKIKGIFKKEQPLLLSSSFGDLQTNMSQVYYDINNEVGRPSVAKTRREIDADIAIKKHNRNAQKVQNRDFEKDK